MEYQETIEQIFERASKVLKLKGFQFRPMQRRVEVNVLKNYTLGYINLKTKVITVDIFTPKRRQPKSINTILRVLAHEFAHFQKMPYLQRFRGKVITRQHYPAFYKRVNKNIKKFKKDKILKNFFRD